MKNLLFIYNPHAGQGKVAGKLSTILDVFAQNGCLPTVYPTQSSGDATKAAKTLGKHFKRVVCCGGDGTLHEVVAGLMELEQPPVLGYIPAGTTNDFSRNLELPRDLALAAKTAVSGPVMECDMGRFNGQSYVYVAAFGAFTQVSYDTPQWIKNMLGHLAYMLEGVASLSTIRSYAMEVDWDNDKHLEGDFIFGMVSNTRSVGGFQGWPKDQVKLDDGAFEVLLVRRPKNLIEVQAILNAVLKQNVSEDGPVAAFHANKVTFTAREAVAWTLDGEFGGEHTKAEIENVTRAMRLVRSVEKNG